jgi:hypothetical protein
VKAHDERGEYVKEDPERLLEDLHLRAVEIPDRVVAHRLVVRSVLELLHVNEHEQEHDRAGRDHRRGGEALAAGVPRRQLLVVSDGTRDRVRHEHADGFVDVDEENDQQPDLDRNQQRIGNEPVRVLVEDLRAGKDERVARKVQDQIPEEQQTRDADEKLRSNGGREVAAESPDGRPSDHRENCS